MVHVQHPVGVSLLPERVVGRSTPCLERFAAQVRIEVGLVADVDPVLVAQVVKTFTLRIALYAEQVDPRHAEFQQVVAQRRFVVGAEVVYRAQFDGTPVDRDALVRELYVTETDFQRGVVGKAAFMLDA